MRKILLAILICVAIPVYVWDVYLIVRGSAGRNGKESESAVSAQNDEEYVIRPVRVARYVKKGRSPFLAYAEKPGPTADKPKVSGPAKPKKQVEAPRITITGIMWNSQNPVAMVTLPDGTSTVAKAGQTLAGGIAVKKVERTRISVVYEGREFWIGK